MCTRDNCFRHTPYNFKGSNAAQKIESDNSKMLKKKKTKQSSIDHTQIYRQKLEDTEAVF